jgi:hypothetical protein
MPIHPIPGTPYYAGLDVHQEYVGLAVVDKAGMVVHDAPVRTAEPGALLTTLRPYHAPPTHPLTVVVQSCPFWPALHDRLVPEAIQFQLAHAPELEAIARAARGSRCRGSSCCGKAPPFRPDPGDGCQEVRGRRPANAPATGVNQMRSARSLTRTTP